MRTGTGSGARKRDRNSVRAFGPPVEVPIARSDGIADRICGFFGTDTGIGGALVGGVCARVFSAGVGGSVGVTGRVGRVRTVDGIAPVAARLGRREIRRPNVFKRGMSCNSTASKTERSFRSDEGLVT